MRRGSAGSSGSSSASSAGSGVAGTPSHCRRTSKPHSSTTVREREEATEKHAFCVSTCGCRKHGRERTFNNLGSSDQREAHARAAERDGGGEDRARRQSSKGAFHAAHARAARHAVDDQLRARRRRRQAARRKRSRLAGGHGSLRVGAAQNAVRSAPAPVSDPARSRPAMRVGARWRSVALRFVRQAPSDDSGACFRGHDSFAAGTAPQRCARYARLSRLPLLRRCLLALAPLARSRRVPPRGKHASWLRPRLRLRPTAC